MNNDAEIIHSFKVTESEYLNALSTIQAYLSERNNFIANCPTHIDLNKDPRLANSIFTLPLSTRLKNGIRAGLEYKGIADISILEFHHKFGKRDIFLWKNLRIKSITELSDIFHEYGIELKP